MVLKEATILWEVYRMKRRYQRAKDRFSSIQRNLCCKIFHSICFPVIFIGFTLPESYTNSSDKVIEESRESELRKCNGYS